MRPTTLAVFAFAAAVVGVGIGRLINLPEEPTRTPQLQVPHVPDSEKRIRLHAGGSPLDNLEAILRAIARAAPDDFPALLLTVGSLPYTERSRAAHYVFKGWAVADPDAALAASLTSEDRNAVLEVWGGSDPEAALRMSGICRRDERLDFVGSALRHCATHDPARALALLLTTPYPDHFATIGLVTEQDPQLAAEHALSLDPARDRDDALRAVVQHWPQDDLAAAATWLSEIHPTLRTRAWHVLFNRLREHDPEIAETIAPEAGLGTDWLWQRRAGENIVSALATARESGDPKALTGALQHLAITDPDRLRTEMADAPKAVRASVALTAAHRWPEDDFSAAVTWIDSWRGDLTEEGIRDAFNTLFIRWHPRTAEEAREIANASLVLPGEKWRTISLATSKLADLDFDSAIAWASTLEHPETAFATIFDERAEHDPMGLAGWLQQFPKEHPARKHAKDRLYYALDHELDERNRTPVEEFLEGEDGPR